MKKVVIIGGGLAGLTNSILLAEAGFEVILFEEKKYPFHRVCGEYISNEVIPFLESIDLFPKELNPARITHFHLTSVSGKSLRMDLDLGGFGVSRYALDHWLSKKCQKAGVTLIHERVVMCKFETNEFIIETREGRNLKSPIVIGSFGKRSTLDKSLTRSFIERRHPYIGVKYHLETEEVDESVVELHNFKDGYCGVSRIENHTYNLCYLSHRNNLRHAGGIDEMEHQIVMENPHLKRIFSNSTILFDKPEVINEITFEKKEPVFDHILMSGDAAGMITPLCGNGMAMAIHSAKVLSELIVENVRNGFDRKVLEENYTAEWNTLFAKRLWAGRKIQGLFGSKFVSELAVGSSKVVPAIAGYLMKKTHGVPF